LATKRYLTKSEIFTSVEGYEGSAETKERMFERDKDDLRSLGIEIEVGSFDPLFNDEAGIKIVNRNQPYAILTTFQNAQGDFDSNKFGSLYLTQSDLQKKVYPVGQDKRYQDFLYKYMIREKSVNMFKKDKLLKKEEDINNQYFPNQQVK